MSPCSKARSNINKFIALLLSTFLLSYIHTVNAANTSQAIGEGIQLIQKGQLSTAKSRLSTAAQPLSGEALFLAARIAEFEHNWTQAMSLYRQYLSEDPFSVHRLEARAAFALLRLIAMTHCSQISCISSSYVIKMLLFKCNKQVHAFMLPTLASHWQSEANY